MGIRYLLDTNVVSELRKKKVNMQVADWVKSIDDNQLYLSCITIGEIETGVLKLEKRDKEAATHLRKWLDELIINYQEQILEIDLAICKEWARLMSIDSTNAIDSLIAAQVCHMNMVLVTRNIKHFEMFDIQLINPFQ